MKMRTALVTLVAGLALTVPSFAQTTIDTTPETGAVGNFGPGSTPTYGQTITVPLTDTVLQSFTFRVNLPATTTFRGEVYAWDGSKATGSALYESAPVNTAGTGMQDVTFTTGGIPLTAGGTYVLFGTTLKDAGSGSGVWGTVPGTTYSGGGFVYYNASNFSSLTSSTWDCAGDCGYGDLAFRAVFSTATGADVSVTKAATTTAVNAGGTVSYQITVTNAGPDVATNVTLTDVTPGGTTFESITEPAGFNCTTPAAGAVGIVTCTAATMSVGSAVFDLVLNVNSDLREGSTVANGATVSASNDTTAGNNTSNLVELPVRPITAPTLSEWGIIALLGGLAAAAALRMRA